MLGIGQITTRVAELIRSAMPFAIVNSGLNRDGTQRPTSLFQRLVSYRTLPEAVAAGKTNGVQWIKLHPGRHPLSGLLTLDTDDWCIEGGGASTLIYQETASTPCITITGDRITLKSMWFTCATTSSRSVSFNGDFGLGIGLGSVSAGFPHTGGTYNVMVGCQWGCGVNPGAQDLSIGGTANIIVAAVCGPGGANELAHIHGTGCGVVGSVIRAAGARSLRMTPGATNSAFFALLIDQGNTMIQGSGNQTGLLEEY